MLAGTGHKRLLKIVRLIPCLVLFAVHLLSGYGGVVDFVHMLPFVWFSFTFLFWGYLRAINVDNHAVYPQMEDGVER